MKEILELINETEGAMLFYGGWGIGKTHLFKNQIYDDLTKNNIVIYYDVRSVMLHNDITTALFDIFSKITTPQVKKQKAKQILNIASSTVNTLLKTNIPKVSTEINMTKFLEEIKTKQVVIIFDEFDRVSGNIILKMLNLLNVLLMGNENLKFICVGNKQEMNSVFTHSLNIKSEKDFLHKYFNNQFNLDEIVKFDSVLNILKESDNELSWLTKDSIDIEVSARELKRWLDDSVWIWDYLSPAFQAYALATKILKNNFLYSIRPYVSQLAIREFTFKDKTYKDTLTIHNNSSFSIKDTHLRFSNQEGPFPPSTPIYFVWEITKVLNNPRKAKQVIKKYIGLDFDSTPEDVEK